MEPRKAEPMIAQYVTAESLRRQALELHWMHVQEYDFNDPRGHFTLPRAEAESELPEGRRWPDVGDSVMLVCTEAGDSFGCVVRVTKVEDSVRDGYLRYETDLAQRMMAERRRRDA